MPDIPTVLKKIHRVLQLTDPGNPGSPGVPAQPAYSYTAYTQVCVWTSRVVGSGSVVRVEPVYSCRTVARRVFVPAQAARPPIPYRPPSFSELSREYFLGWNARAHYLTPTTGPIRYEFTIPPVVGVVAGLTKSPRPSGYADIEFGFRMQRNELSIIQSGNVVADLGVFSNPVLEIERGSAQIVYKVNGTEVGTATALPGSYQLSAAFYSGGDSITGTSFEALSYSNLAGSAARMTGVMSEAGYDFINSNFPAPRGEMYGDPAGYINAPFLAPTGYMSEGPYSHMEGSILPMVGLMEAYALAPDWAIMDGEFMGMSGVMQGLSGTLGRIETETYRMDGLMSQNSYGYMSGEIAPMGGLFGGFTQGEAVVVGFADVMAPLDGFATLFAIMNERMELAGVYQVSRVLSADVMAELVFDDSLSLSSVLQAAVTSLMSAGAIAGLTGSGFTVWTLNLESDGSTRYENYDFNSFAEINGKYYGAKSDGVYLLRGPDDDGQDIESLVNFGNLSFGSLNRKSMPYLYAGMASDGKLVLKVIADGQTFYYTARDSTALLKAHRFELGRGLRASYYDLEIQATGGQAFDLATVEFFPIELKRML